MLRRVSLCLAFSVAAAAVVPALAAIDPIVARRAVMKSVGAAAGTGVKMMKEELPYDPTVAALVLTTLHAASHGVGAHFVAGTDKGDTKARPDVLHDGLK